MKRPNLGPVPVYPMSGSPSEAIAMPASPKRMFHQLMILRRGLGYMNELVNEVKGSRLQSMETRFLRPVPASGGRESFDILSRGRAPCASSRSGAK